MRRWVEGRRIAPALKSKAMIDKDNSFISLREVKKIYRSKRGDVVALENVSFDIAKNTFGVIVGPSGCGKSTVLKIVAGLLSYDAGSVALDGVRVTGPVRDVGLVFQNPALFRWKTVLGNVLAPIELMGLNRRHYLQRARELIALAGLQGFENRYPRELSGGMQQRVAICRALIHNPKLLLMDEPFGALDAMTRDKMNLEILRIWHEEKKTVLFVTHSIHEAVFLADIIVVLSNRPATVRKIISVELPRPRTLELRATREYNNYVIELLQELFQTFEQ